MLFVLMYVVYSVHLFSFSRHASYFPQEVVLPRNLYISPKDSKTYYTFYNYCKKNINSFREMFSNNLLSGSVRFLESVLIALAIAVGMALAWALVF